MFAIPQLSPGGALAILLSLFVAMIATSLYFIITKRDD
jgi:hypothetical protein